MGTVSTWTAVVAPTCSTGSGIQATLANVALLEPSPFGTAPTGQLVPGTRTVTALLSGIDSNFSTANSPTTTLTINKEDAKATFTGSLFYGIPLTATSGTITLSATIQDTTAVDSISDPNAGDIRNAKVTFVDRATGTPFAGCSNLSVGLVNLSDSKTGSV